MNARVIIAANRLPVHITERGGQLVLERSLGGLATAMQAVFTRHPSVWVGWSGMRRRLHQRELDALRIPARYAPVQIDANLAKRYYDNVANRTLWPVFHGFDSKYLPSTKDWEAYHEVARRFTASIRRMLQPDDVIWVHDYHLLLVAEYLRRAGVNNRIGLFLHTPFPQAKHFKRLPQAGEILASLSKLDVLGLQTLRDVRRFHECLEQSGKDMRRPELVRDFPIGVDAQAYRAGSEHPGVQKLLGEIKRTTQGQRIILSISRLDYTKGIIMQLEAVARFLKQLPHPEQFVYKVVVAPSREAVVEYRKLKRSIEQTVARINRSLGNGQWQPIDYSYTNFGFKAMCAWYLAADVMLLAPEIDGMNLIAKEYVATRQDNTGALVLSKTTGAARQLRSALLINPHDEATIVSALHHACNRGAAQRKQSWNALRETVNDQDVFWWADEFLAELHRR